MKVIELTPKELDLKQFKKRTALEKDASTLIQEDTLITVDGKPRILYCKCQDNTDAMRWAVKTMKYDKSNRSGGLKTESRLFGYMPRIVRRNDFCHVVSTAEKFPKQHFVLCDFARVLIKYYNEYFPDILKEHYHMAQQVKEDWQLRESPFTSGIVNQNNVLKYHHDGGNFKGVLSNMIVFKNNVVGGHLVCPEFDVKFECSDKSIVIFDGQEILHGVTNIIKKTKHAYRYSVVYYTLQQMWNCEGINTEIERIRKVKKTREFNRLNTEENE